MKFIKNKFVIVPAIAGAVWLAWQYSKYVTAGGNNGANGTFYQWMTYS